MCCPPGFPDHELELKIGSIAMLIRNLDVRAGLVNGTRLLVTSISTVKVTCVVLNGNAIIDGEIVHITRVPFVGRVSDLINMERIQFPLRCAFCITYNKSQGQTLEKVFD